MRTFSIKRPSFHPTNSVKALKETQTNWLQTKNIVHRASSFHGLLSHRKECCSLLCKLFDAGTLLNSVIPVLYN